jgi:tellurite resistance protein
MLDWDRIKKKASELYDEATKKIKQYTPESFSKEKKLVNAIVISLALITLADKKIETEEVTKSMELIKDIEEIQELNMVQEAIELYQFHLEDLEKVINNEPKYLLKVEHKLMDIAKIKEYEGYPNMIKVLLDYIAEADGRLDPTEVEMKNKILQAIGLK